MSSQQLDKGPLSLLEWTNKLLPQASSRLLGCSLTAAQCSQNSASLKNTDYQLMTELSSAQRSVASPTRCCSPLCACRPPVRLPLLTDLLTSGSLSDR